MSIGCHYSQTLGLPVLILLEAGGNNENSVKK